MVLLVRKTVPGCRLWPLDFRAWMGLLCSALWGVSELGEIARSAFGFVESAQGKGWATQCDLGGSLCCKAT